MQKVPSFFLGSVALIRFPDDDPLGIETRRSIPCDIVIYTLKGQYCTLW
jgi:hypothetical protein